MSNIEKVSSPRRDWPGEIADAPLFVVPRVLERLRAYRAEARFGDLPPEQGEPLAAEVADLAGRLLEGIDRHPTRFWVIRQVEATLASIGPRDGTTCAKVDRELGRLMDIVGIADAPGCKGRRVTGGGTRP